MVVLALFLKGKRPLLNFRTLLIPEVWLLLKTDDVECSVEFHNKHVSIEIYETQYISVTKPIFSSTRFIYWFEIAAIELYVPVYFAQRICIGFIYIISWYGLYFE